MRHARFGSAWGAASVSGLILVWMISFCSRFSGMEIPPVTDSLCKHALRIPQLY